MVSRQHRDAAKVQRVIDSCLTVDQVLIAHTMFKNYCTIYSENNWDLWFAFTRKHKQLSTNE